MKVTVTEIARRVGCSPATVSRALNGTGGVEASLRRRIRVAVRAMDQAAPGTNEPRRGRPRGALGRTGSVQIIVFRPGGFEPLVVSASNLAVGPLTEVSTNLFLSPRFRLAMDFYRHVINGVVSVFSACGIKTIQRECNDLLDPVLLQALGESRLCGILVMGLPDPQVSDFAAACDCPVVLIDILGVENVPVVAIDNSGATTQALTHLIGLGHRRIGFVGSTDNPSFRERYNTFLGGMAAAGLPVHSEWHYGASSHMREIAEGLQPMLRSARRPSALLCACDHYAIGALEAAQLAGLAVPGSLSLVGIDDIEAAALTHPPLTTVRVPMVQLGACAADLLMRMTAGTRERDNLQNCEIRCRTELVIRESTASPGEKEPDRRSAKPKQPSPGRGSS